MIELDFNKLLESAPLLVRRKVIALKSLRERPDFHPEPSTYEHIKIVTERLFKTGNPDLILSGVLHDICKLDCAKTNPKTGWPSSPGHEEEAYKIVNDSSEIKDWIFRNGGNWLRVSIIVRDHGKIHLIDQMRPKKRLQYIEMWKENEVWELLNIFGEADDMLKEFDASEVLNRDFY